jgi:hypothetical protein
MGELSVISTFLARVIVDYSDNSLCDACYDGGMDENRLSRLEGSYDALKVVRPMTITVVGIFLAALVFVLSFLSAQIVATNNKLDALQVSLDGRINGTNAKVDGLQAKLDAQTASINAQLSAEFRAMRAEMSAQTTAIASSITAARQMQNGAPPATSK